MYTADFGAGTARYCSGTGTAGTGLQVLVLRVCRSGIVVCFGVHGCIISHMYTPHFRRPIGGILCRAIPVGGEPPPAGQGLRVGL
eukprot:SAG31_NODE_1189_length_9480_cov_19.686174_1_plen_85_part_00